MNDTQPIADKHAPESDEPSWLGEEEALPPPRPRRRLLAPLPLSLIAALLIACGFIAGVLVEKGQTGSASGALAGGGFTGREAALSSALGKGGGLAGGAGPASSGASEAAGALGATSGGSGASGGSGTSGGGVSGASGAGGASGGTVTAGTVAFVSKGTLYVRTSEGSTVKVKPVAGAKVTRTVASSVAHIHPGETVLVTGATAANGSIAANSIRAGAQLGGSLFGGGGSGAAAGGPASGGGAGTSSGTGGEQPLFGKG
jgi:hypothetical protein